MRKTIEKAQQIVLEALLLDRENEQLLLKCALGQKAKGPAQVASSDRIRKTYRNVTERKD